MGATWQPMSGPRGTTPFAETNCHVFINNSSTCLSVSLPSQQPTTSAHLPHVRPTTSSVQACHMSPQIGPPVLSMSATIRLVTLPRQLYGPCHIIANCACHVRCTNVQLVQSAATWHCMDYTVIIFC
jgi:hypothetical protein